MLEVEDERGSEQDADQARHEREPVGQVESDWNRDWKTPTGVAVGPALRATQAPRPSLVVGVRHLNAGRDQERGEQGEDPEGDRASLSAAAASRPRSRAHRL